MIALVATTGALGWLVTMLVDPPCRWAEDGSQPPPAHGLRRLVQAEQDRCLEPD
jgi:hypothetical protein